MGTFSGPSVGILNSSSSGSDAFALLAGVSWASRPVTEVPLETTLGAVELSEETAEWKDSACEGRGGLSIFPSAAWSAGVPLTVTVGVVGEISASTAICEKMFQTVANAMKSCVGKAAEVERLGETASVEDG